MNIHDVMAAAPVIPVLVLDGSHDPVALAETLVDAGLKVLEVTLRTDNALADMEKMATVEGAIVGAGTVLNSRHLGAARDAGAQFIVSPGLTDTLAKAAEGMAFLPGVASAGDIMRGMDHGLDAFKFFPAEANGGLAALKAICGPFKDLSFCPTGGVTEASAPDWLAHPQVKCVGGSWVVPKGASLDEIAAKARAAAAL